MYVSEINKDIDAWLINIGWGAVDQVNTMNTCNFGKLTDAYFCAANIDIAIICVNPSTDVSYLRLQPAHMYKYGIEEIFIVLSHYEINASTIDYKDGLQTYYVDDSKYFAAFNNLKKNIEEKVFTFTDVENGVLYKNIIELLS